MAGFKRRAKFIDYLGNNFEFYFVTLLGVTCKFLFVALFDIEFVAMNVFECNGYYTVTI